MPDKHITQDNLPKVDAVILWVDGTDPEWLKEKNRYLPQSNSSYKASTSGSRFRSWDNLQYVFRGIEKFMPWINRIYFITWGHIPSWLNTDNERLRIVRHEEFIPKEYLPTFNSNTIELNLHRIKDLSENFINFNDDTFVIGPTTREDFFKDNIPCSEGIITPYPIRKNGISCSEARNIEVINSHFSKRNVLSHKSKWVNFIYGTKALRTLFFLRFSWIVGIYEPHSPLSLHKSTLKKIWEEEPETLNETSLRKFRGKSDVNIWLVRQWQMMEGDFTPRGADFSKLLIMPRDAQKVNEILANPGKCRLLCINDSNIIEEGADMEIIMADVNKALSTLLPRKSSFER